MVVAGLTFNGEPLPARVPPQEPVYHFHEAAVPNEPPLTLKLAEPPEQKLLLSAEADAGAVEGMQQAVTKIFWDADDVEL